MEKDFDNIIKKFYEINKKGYIKGINENINNSFGLTLEYLLKKKPDSLFFPDYNNIEIKTTQRFSHYPVSLFSIAFDGPEAFESNALLEKYGKNDNVFKNKKILITNLKCNHKILVNNKYYFELVIDYNNERLAINIYDKNETFLEQRAYIDFNTLKNRLEIKFKKLALIYASKKKETDGLYFRYYKIQCFILKEFDTFLNLMGKNIIRTSLQLRITRTGTTAGQQKNKTIIFQINKCDIDKLFTKVYEYEK